VKDHMQVGGSSAAPKAPAHFVLRHMQGSSMLLQHITTDRGPWVQRWVPAVEAHALAPPWGLGHGSCIHSPCDTARLLLRGFACQAVLRWSADPWSTSWAVMQGERDRGAALWSQGLSHKSPLLKGHQEPRPFAPETPGVSPTVTPGTGRSHSARKVMLKTNVLQHLSMIVVVCRYEKTVSKRQVVHYINAV